MIKGLYSAVSAMITGLDRQSVIAHNAANLDTPGFKQIMMTMEEFKETGVFTAESAIDPSSPFGGNVGFDEKRFVNINYVGSHGTGVNTAFEETNLTQGALLNTEEPLDLAIEGNGYFKLQTPDGMAYTRDGRFNLNANREIVSVDGYYLMDQSDQIITVPEGSIIEVDSSGIIYLDNDDVANISIVSFENELESLQRGNDNTFTSEIEPDGETVGVIAQGYLESSNVDVAQLMTQMVSVVRSYEAAQQLVTIQDELLGRSISTLGRI
ncbi:MAG: flagellar hook-basal body protein [Anaerolineaceae bacterium]|nr:flagellar hook-basal body protein [Anaerolineaceae bacterium]